jgi:hypothetical protein
MEVDWSGLGMVQFCSPLSSDIFGVCDRLLSLPSEVPFLKKMCNPICKNTYWLLPKRGIIGRSMLRRSSVRGRFYKRLVHCNSSSFSIRPKFVWWGLIKFFKFFVAGKWPEPLWNLTIGGSWAIPDKILQTVLKSWHFFQYKLLTFISSISVWEILTIL